MPPTKTKILSLNFFGMVTSDNLDLIPAAQVEVSTHCLLISLPQVPAAQVEVCTHFIRIASPGFTRHASKCVLHTSSCVPFRAAQVEVSTQHTINAQITESHVHAAQV